MAVWYLHGHVNRHGFVAWQKNARIFPREGILLLRESGFDPPPDPELAATFEELDYLERSIGRTGRLAILPFVHHSDRDVWQLQLLGRK